MDAPFHVEYARSAEHGLEYVIVRTGVGPLVRGPDMQFVYHLCDLLNEDAKQEDIHR